MRILCLAACAGVASSVLEGGKGFKVCSASASGVGKFGAPSQEATNSSGRDDLSVAGSFLTAATTAATSTAPRPHIVMAIFDDMGANDLGSFSGGQLTPRTPFMDELMATGIKLKQYYVTPICSPTRSALMTGRYAMRMGGQHGVVLPFDPTWIPEDESLLSERLSALGYRCVASGKWHLGNGHFKYGPTARGFSEFFGPYAGGADHWEHLSWIGGGPDRDAQRRSQHAGRDSDGAGASVMMRRPRVNQIDQHHDRWTRDGRFVHEAISSNNLTHSTDVFTREAIRMVWEHDEHRDGPLFLYLPYTAPHWPTQFWQHHADLNRHIPGVKRQEFAGMITHLDESLRHVVETLRRRRMWENTLFIAFADNGGDVTTAASNWPYRGTKGTVWEGGTRAAAFIHSPNVNIVPLARRGTESHALIHVTDWLPTLLHLAGASAAAVAAVGHPLDGVNVLDALLDGRYDPVNGPRREMLYAMDMVVPKMGTDKMATIMPNMWFEVIALRVGDWKLIEGLPGRGDWYGEDPSLAWPVDYIIGPDATDYEAIARSPGGKVGDGGQQQLKADYTAGSGVLKRRWLFNLANDPTEQKDLAEAQPEKVQELLKRMQQLLAEQVPPFENGGDIAGAFANGNIARAPDSKFGTTPSGKSVFLSDYWTEEGYPQGTEVLLDGEKLTLGKPPSRQKSKL